MEKKSRTQYVFTISAQQGGGFLMGVAFFYRDWQYKSSSEYDVEIKMDDHIMYEL